MANGRKQKEESSSDVLTKAQRSHCMSRIRGRDTKPEITLRKALWKLGLRFRIHHGLPGRPDIVFPRYRLVVFVDGCFWHRCPLHWRAPRTNSEFWEQKISGNQQRDAAVNGELDATGWRVIRLWEHEVKESPSAAAERIKAFIKQI